MRLKQWFNHLWNGKSSIYWKKFSRRLIAWDKTQQKKKKRVDSILTDCFFLQRLIKSQIIKYLRPLECTLNTESKNKRSKNFSALIEYWRKHFMWTEKKNLYFIILLHSQRWHQACVENIWLWCHQTRVWISALWLYIKNVDKEA